MKCVWLGCATGPEGPERTPDDRDSGRAPARMQCVPKQRGARRSRRASRRAELVERLDGLLPPEALEEALAGLDPEQITGPGGLLTQLAGRVIETALGGRADRASRAPARAACPPRANVRNGSTPKTLADRARRRSGSAPRATATRSFAPQLVGKRQTRLAGLDARVLDLYAGGMSTRDIAAHLTELYGVEVGRDTISRVTDAVLDDVQAWRTRPLERSIRSSTSTRSSSRSARTAPSRTAPAISRSASPVTASARRWGSGGSETEGAKFWLAVLNDLHRRGVEDVLICCVDGLKGFPEAIEAVFPQAWVQTCIVHQIRASLRYVNYRDRKRVAAALRPDLHRRQRRRRAARARALRRATGARNTR